MARPTQTDAGPVDQGVSAATGVTTADTPQLGAWSVDDVQIEEDPPPRRLRRPLDALRLGASVILALLIGALAAGTVDASEELTVDLRRNVLTAPQWLIGVVGFASALAGLVMIIALLGSLALSRRLRALGEAVLGGLVGAALCWVVNWWIGEAAPDRVRVAFEAGLGQTIVAVPSYLGFVVGTLSVQGWRGRPWLIRASLVAVVGGALTALADGRTTVQGALVAVLLGRVGGLAIRLGFGTPVRRPSGRDLARALAAAQLMPTRLVAASDDAHQYLAWTTRGPLAVALLFRDQLGGGLLGRAWRLLRTRDEITAHHSITLRGMADQRALVAYAFEAAGVRAPALRACLQVGSDAVLLAYDHVPERPVAAKDATDDFQQDLWRQVLAMQQAGLAHRRLGPTGIRVDDAGRPWLVDRDGGQVAASELAQLTDVAQLLVTLAVLSTPERAVENAVAVLRAQRVSPAYALLQPIVLSASGRRALRGHPELLQQLRSLLMKHGAEADRATPELERFKPRRLLTIVALVIAAYLAGSQLTGVDVVGLIRGADPAWVGVAFIACCLTYLLDPPALLAFVPQRVSYLRAVGAQIALSFVKLVMPSTLGNAALDFRLLTHSGVPASTALAAAGASQALAFIVAVPLLLVLGIATGRAASVGITPSATSLIIVVLVIACLGLLALAPPVRQRARQYWESFASSGLAVLLDAIQDPRRIAAAIGGALGVTFAFVGCLYASLAAVGATGVPIAVLAVVWLTGNTLGTAVPTPGGLGAVEVALTAGLTAAGVEGSTAISAVLLFRMITFWIPIPLGWIFWTQMQKKGLL